ncbi:MAG TPA: hypothetical protein VE866_05315 [Candidatus Binatia bacterium]|nr:hypothetical protein [Candidatus Binatia bacterium]
MRILGLVAVLTISGLAGAAEKSGSASVVEIPQTPNTSRYWTKTNTALVATDALAKSLDMMFTMRNAGKPNFQEHDPLARPFVTHGRAIAGVGQGLLFAGEVFSSYELNKHGHRKLAKVVLLLGIGGNTAGVATSVR